jgi:glycosyltransferase involved in cell wall biosynthesis
MPPTGGAPIFLMIARLLRDKGVMEFVDAARQIKARHPKAQFQLLGAAGSENRSSIDHATVNNWVKEGVIEYLGTTNDVRPAISAASCVLLPSYREGAPRTLIEAAAMARPVISTDVPGCRAVVDNNISGFLCDARSADSLAATIERFLSLSPGAQKTMGQFGRAKMERKYDQSIVVDAYRQAISRLVKPGMASESEYAFLNHLKTEKYANAS